MKKARLPRREWIRIVRSWRRSKLDASSFVAREGDRFSSRMLRFWSNRLEKEEASPRGRGRSRLEFVEVDRAAPDAPKAVAPAIELSLPSGLSLRLDSGTPADRLAELVRLLEAR